MIPVVLSGGVGSRLWPLSRGKYPKQLLPLVDDKTTMLQQTILRVQSIDQITPPIVVCNEEHRFMVGEQLQSAGVEGATIVLEPAGRNTAPAIALAAHMIAAEDPKQIMLVMPADHVVQDEVAFCEAVNKAVNLADRGHLVTFGIVPNKPETGYGYIQSGGEIEGLGYEVAQFKEKPDLEAAQQYVDAGDYYWNGGIFVFSAESFLADLKKFEPDVFKHTKAAVDGLSTDLDFTRINADDFSESPDISIDYAVMERTDKAAVVPLDVGWNDVGSWSALWEVSQKDTNGNSIHGDVLLHDTKNSHIYSENKLVSAVGLDGMVVVETPDAVMVAPKSESQNVKEIVKQLKAQKRSQLSHHRKVFRPWGWYDSLDFGKRFQVKRILVNPGAKLSVQMHYHRAEHWVVVRGTAEVLNGEETILLRENESTFIPIGTTHALRNPSESQPLEIIEVQSGSYLGEDDIVRFEDNYGRAGTTK